MISRRDLLWLLLAGSLALPQGYAFAEDGGDGGGDDGGGGDGGGGDDGGDDDAGKDDDQNRALNAVRNDSAATLKEILAIVRKKYEGEIVHVSLRGSGPNLIYRIKLLDENNRLIEVHVNAVSRRIMRIKGT